MERITGYSDLNIPIGPQCEAVSRTAVKLGYVTLALNTPILTKDVANNSSSKGGKKRKWEERSGGVLATTAQQMTKGQGPAQLPPPPAFPWIKQIISQNPGVRIAQRLTLIFNDMQQLQTAISHPNSKLYDIIALLPTSHDALVACLTSSTLVFDLISFDFQGPHWIQKLRLNRQKGDLAAGKEIHFELTYSSAIHGDSALENLIYTAHSLLENVCVKRIKNLVLTSGSGTPLEIRSPKDVISIGYLLGLDEGTTRVSCREATHKLIQKTEGRKLGKTWALFVPSPSTHQAQEERPKEDTET